MVGMIKGIEEIKRVTVKNIQGTFINVLKSEGEMEGHRYANALNNVDIIKHQECDVILAKVTVNKEDEPLPDFGYVTFGSTYINPYGTRRKIKPGDYGYGLYFLQKGQKIGEQEDGGFFSPNYKQVIFVLKEHLPELEKFVASLETENAFVIVENVTYNYGELLKGESVPPMPPTISINGNGNKEQKYARVDLFNLDDVKLDNRPELVYETEKLSVDVDLKVYFGEEKVHVLHSIIPRILLGNFANNFKLDDQLEDFDADKLLYSAKCNFENLLHTLKLPVFPEDVASYFTFNLRGDYTGPNICDANTRFTPEEQAKFKEMSDKYESWDEAMTKYTNIKEAAMAFILAIENRSLISNRYGSRNPIYTSIFNRINDRNLYFLPKHEEVGWEGLNFSKAEVIRREYVKQVFLPDNKVDLETLKDRLHNTFDYTWYGETDEGEEYMNISTDRATDNVGMISDMYTGLDVSKLKEINPFIAKLEKLLTVKLEKHIKPTINFGSCSVENVTRYAAERAVRIDILRDILYKLRLIMLLNEKVFKENIISVMELNRVFNTQSIGIDVNFNRTLSIIGFVDILSKFPEEELNVIINKTLKEMARFSVERMNGRIQNNNNEDAKLKEDGTLDLGREKYSYGGLPMYNPTASLVEVIEFEKRMSSLGVEIK